MKTRRNLFAALAMFALMAVSAGTIAAAPRLDPNMGGGTIPLCVAASADAPNIGQALVGDNGNYTVFTNGHSTDVKVAEEGRLASGHGPALITDSPVVAPACGSANGIVVVNGAHFALTDDGRHPANVPYAMP